MQQATVTRTARQGLRTISRHTPATRRNLAAPASGSFAYQSGESSGVKLASRDVAGPTTTLSLVARAGTRYQPLPGFSDALEKYALKSTDRRSALRICREIELLGGEVVAYHSRENLVLTAKFLRDDLPYFTELLGEVITRTRYTNHELHEEVIPSIKFAYKQVLGSTSAMALNSAHSLAFHRGLGNPLHPTSSTPLTKYLNPDHIKMYSEAAYAKNNFAVVANGTNHDQFSKWVGQFFGEASATAPGDAPTIEPSQSKYYGGEERIAHDSGNTMIIAFPGSSSATGKFFKPEIEVLASLLGGQSSIKWTPGFSLLAKAGEAHPGVNIHTESWAYSDAGLLAVTLSGKASAIRDASSDVVKAIKGVANGQISGEDFSKAKSNAKFRILESGQNIHTGLELTGTGLINGSKPYQVDEVGKAIDSVSESSLKEVAKTLVEGKVTVSSVGDLFQLPYAEELGLTV